MENFWESDVWGWVLLMGVLLGSLLVGNIVKKVIPFLKNSLIPTSVLGGLILLVVAAIYKAFTGDVMFDTAIFNGSGTKTLSKKLCILFFISVLYYGRMDRVGSPDRTIF